MRLCLYKTEVHDAPAVIYRHTAEDMYFTGLGVDLDNSDVCPGRIRGTWCDKIAQAANPSMGLLLASVSEVGRFMLNHLRSFFDQAGQFAQCH